MKYWNKSKKYRDTWHTVKIDYDHRTTDWEYMKYWCQYNSSTFRFYSGNYTRNVWYFENSEDALIFKLRFAVGRNNG